MSPMRYRAPSLTSSLDSSEPRSSWFLIRFSYIKPLSLFDIIKNYMPSETMFNLAIFPYYIRYFKIKNT